MSTYLVTGAAGFIGARISQQLLDEGHIVLGIDNLNDAYDVRLKQWRLDQLVKNSAFHFHRQDICDFNGLKNACSGEPRPDGIIHLAARAGVRASVIDPWAYVQTNVNGTLNMLELARGLEIPKFVFASTSSIYGANPPYPTPETADSSMPLQPYAASKKGAEALCHSYHFLHGLDITIFRFFTVYGPAGRPDLAMFRFVRWIQEGETLHVNGDGKQTRGFTYIDDIARGVLLGLKPTGYEIINLGGHETISINDLIALVEDVLGKKAVIQTHQRNPADMQANWADVEKAKALLGWEPKINLREGVSRLAVWYLQNRAWASTLKLD